MNQCPHCHHTLKRPKTLGLRRTHCDFCGQALYTPPSIFTRSLSTEPAHVFHRLMARAIDYLIITCCVILYDQLTGHSLWEGVHWILYGVIEHPDLHWDVVSLSIAHVAYFSTFHAFSWQTPGKAVCQISLSTPTQERPLLLFIIWREIVLLATLTLGGGLLLLTFLSPTRRAPHDWLAHTLVVEEEPQSSIEPQYLRRS